jgi:quinol monooxygenase YgiN
MIVRIVCMSFDEAHIDTFLRLFDSYKEQIRSFDGCLHLELLQQESAPSVFFTYSHWRDEAALENYRQSELFLKVWGETKKYFNQQPQAWSLKRHHCLP